MKAKDIYGLALGGDLLEALRSPEFAREAKRLATAFLHHRKAFSAVDLVSQVILGKE